MSRILLLVELKGGNDGLNTLVPYADPKYRELRPVIGVARECGMMDGVPPFLGMDAFDRLPRDKILALATGSQGEPRAALSRIAQDDHPEVAFSRGDRVIFSSRAIPGNEKAVARVINGLVDQGI